MDDHLYAALLIEAYEWKKAVFSRTQYLTRSRYLTRSTYRRAGYFYLFISLGICNTQTMAVLKYARVHKLKITTKFPHNLYLSTVYFPKYTIFQTSFPVTIFSTPTSNTYIGIRTFPVTYRYPLLPSNHFSSDIAPTSSFSPILLSSP